MQPRPSLWAEPVYATLKQGRLHATRVARNPYELKRRTSTLLGGTPVPIKIFNLKNCKNYAAYVNITQYHCFSANQDKKLEFLVNYLMTLKRLKYDKNKHFLKRSMSFSLNKRNKISTCRRRPTAVAIFKARDRLDLTGITKAVKRRPTAIILSDASYRVSDRLDLTCITKAVEHLSLIHI